MSRRKSLASLSALLSAALLPAGLALAAASATSAAPAALQPLLAGLPQEQQAFIANDQALQRFGLTREKLYLELQKRDNGAAEAYIAAMMTVVEDGKYHPGTDLAAIPLNRKAVGYNAASVLRPALLDERAREPGPFSLDRYVQQKGGIPTFAGAPIAIRKEDLVAGKVEVAFVGAPLDFSSGWRNGKHGPKALRAMYGLAGNDIYASINPSLELRIADYGDLAMDYMSVERGITHVRTMVGEMASLGVIPFIVGGDHALMYPDVAAMIDTYGKGKVGVVHLDAHYNGARDGDHFLSDEQAVSRLVKDGLIEGKNLIQVGLRGPEPDSAALGWMRQQGFRYHTMAEVENSGWEAVMQRAVQEAKDGPDKIFISFDISVLDPAAAAGAGRPVPGGLTMREALPLVRRLCAETQVVGFEMLDVAPVLDLSYQTALNANYIMHACLTGIAMRKKGLTQEHYLSPLSTAHNQK